MLCYFGSIAIFYLSLGVLKAKKAPTMFLQLCVMGWFFYNSIDCFDNGSNFDMFNVNGA